MAVVKEQGTSTEKLTSLPIDSRKNSTYKTVEKKFPERVAIEEIDWKSSPAIFDDVSSAVSKCVQAQAIFAAMPLQKRKAIIEAIRHQAKVFAEDFAMCAWSETGRGRYEDKLKKQYLAADATPGVEDITPRCFTGDAGMTVIDSAPYGVFGAVTPVTNPTATVINNAITLLSGGNGVVFNAHPSAMNTTNRAVAVLSEAIVQAGAPEGIIAAIAIPTIESGQKLLSHPETACNLVTGGPAVVQLALKTGKKTFGAGPGNPPVVVDETADMGVTAKGIYDGASFDNNMICSDEKEIFCVQTVADELIARLRSEGAHIACPEEVDKLTQLCIPIDRKDFHHGQVDRTLVGCDASVLLSKIGVEAPASCRLIVCDVSEGHPLVWTEQLMPVIPLVRCPDFKSCLELAVKAEYGYKHTASIYSSSLERITEMARALNTSIFCVNGPHYAGLGCGGEGCTSFSIAGATGEGLTRPSTFVRERRLVCVNSLRFV